MAWKVPLLDEDLHPKLAARAYCEFHYAYVRGIVGALPFSAFVRIPVVSLVHTRKIIADWIRQAPQAAVIRGSKWETHLHKYIPFMAFSVLENQRVKTFIFVKEEPDHLSPEKKDYLRRLILGEPCGIWEEKEGGRLMRKRGEIPENKRAKSMCSVVELALPSPHQGFTDPFKYF
ncbi:MAG: hypothetical protein JSS10_03325 [Verrucomicrobia bacterium]|nr:hypothetical protein [Verrucomicrobiota bacterium]